MSEEMAVSDNATGEDALSQISESAVENVEQVAQESSVEATEVSPEETPAQTEDTPPLLEAIKEEPQADLTEEKVFDQDIKDDPADAELDNVIVKEEVEETEAMLQEQQEHQEDDKRGIKRRASDAFSNDGDVEFIGFEDVKQDDVTMEYSQILERLEAEVSEATKTFTPVRLIMAPAPLRAIKRSRKDTGTDGSRPSSAQSSRSEDDTYQRLLPLVSLPPSASPAQRGRRATTEISSPLLRVPLDRGWKRELVYRAALDVHSRRNADIYYYTPQGKKLRSTREIAENLSGTGLTLENFSFFKEPLGVDDPEREIIRDAKVIRRVESPVAAAAPPVDGKRQHKPKAPKGASPEPTTPKTAPLKLKVKSMGSRLSSSTPPAKPEKQKKAAPSPSPAPAAPSPTAQPDNNNSAWKKPRPPAADQEPLAPAPVAPGLVAPAPAAPGHVAPAPAAAGPDFRPALIGTRSRSTHLSRDHEQTSSRESTPVSSAPVTPATYRDVTPVAYRDVPATREASRDVVVPVSREVTRDVAPVSREVTPVSREVPGRDVTAAPAVPRVVTPPPQPQPQRLQDLSSPDMQSPRRVLQPCSLACGAGVPSLSCAACLCMYHPRCAGYLLAPPAATFLCKNCRKSTSPPPVPPQIKATNVGAAAGAVPTPRRVPVAAKPPEKRVTLRMKMSGGSDGSRVWAVAEPPRAPPPRAAARAPAPRRSALPQSLAVINGKRFIVVPRPAPLPAQPAPPDGKLRGRVANGSAAAAGAPAAASPRRRGRPRNDDTDHFTAFYNRAQEGNTNVVVQIFQYLGMRDLAHCARVCKLWKQLAATPSLWRHVRMKNSQVSDWGGLCAALKRHGTKWLDLRKMLLPQNDTVFWEQFAQHIGSVDSLERLEMCRCPARAVEAAAGSLRGLRALSALAIRDAALDPAPLGCAGGLRELRLKSMTGLALTADLTHLARLTNLHHLSLTSIKELGWRACDVIGSLPNLESLELGECTFRAEFASVLARLTRLTRLRLERGTAQCAAPAILRALARLPRLHRLELVNVDVKVGFDDALAECTNIQRLLIIPTYVSQSATTNKQVLSGVLRLKETLTHLMWGVTIELLRVTELFIDQCSAGGGARRDLGECIPVLKPVPGCRLPMDHQLVAGPPQVEILPLPTLQRLLAAQLPNTKLKLLRIPFHATWRQSLADFQ